MGDDGDFGEVENFFNRGVAILFALRIELFLCFFGRVVEVIFVNCLAFGGDDEDDFFDTSSETFFDDELEMGRKRLAKPASVITAFLGDL